MNVTYYHHSGFAVELLQSVLVFDYYTASNRHAYFDPAQYPNKQIIFFASHAHSDHYDEAILQWANQASYVLSDDIAPTPVPKHTLFVAPNQTYTFEGLSIKTLASNDEGVAFLVETEGKCIYHAGDLNWWHWEGEPDPFNQDIAKSYHDALKHIKGTSIDIAFVPADPRLREQSTWATDYFMKEIGATHVFPMHLWGKFSMCQAFQEKTYAKQMHHITKTNETFVL